MLILAIIASTFLLVSNGLDIAVTVDGLRRGLALEGNQIIRAIFGTRPELWQLALYEGAWYSALSAGAIGFATVHNMATAAFFGACIGKGALHVQGFFKWRRLGARL